MRNLFFVTLLISLASTVCFADSKNAQAAHFSWFAYEGRDSQFDLPVKPGHFQNPILAGFYPDPSITRVGDTFYMVNSSFAYFPGVPIFKSTDLVHWQSLGYVLTRPEQLRVANAGVSRGIFAPAIRHHKDTFYVITTGVDAAGGNFIVTANDAAGPWSDPVFLPEIDGIDPSLFFDDDGKVYITHNGPPPGEALYEGHRAIWLWEYDPTNKKVIGDSRKLLVNGGVDLSKKPIWIEAPHIHKINGWYYLFCAEGGTAENHSEVVFRTRDLKEPFIAAPNNPILTQRDLDPGRANPIATAGHADIVQTAAGEWWAVFLATRNYDKQFFNTGRETFLLPVTWTDGWPHILPPGTAIPWQLPKPAGLKPTDNATALTGNFQWRDDFSKSQLGFEWNLLRTSMDLPYRLIAGSGVALSARKTSMADLSQPAFIGRRQQHQTYSASTRLQLPLADGVLAGIVAFQSEQAHYFLGVKSLGKNQGYRLVLEKAESGPPQMIHSKDLPFKIGDQIDLKIDGDKGLIGFYYRTAKDKQWQLFADKLDATLMSTQKAGGFVGSYLGIHARVVE